MISDMIGQPKKSLEFTMEKSMVLESYESCAQLGRFALLDDNRIVALGLILSAGAAASAPNQVAAPRFAPRRR